MYTPRHPCSPFPADWARLLCPTACACPLSLGSPVASQGRHGRQKSWLPAFPASVPCPIPFLLAPLPASLRPTHSSAFVETIITHPDSARATCPTFALQPFQKGGFYKLKSDLESLSPAFQSSTSCKGLSYCHLLREACTDTTPAPAHVTSVCLLGQFQVALVRTVSAGLEWLWAQVGSLS